MQYTKPWTRCRTCRKRKTKCDGDQPVCKPCKLGGHVCLGYAESSRSLLGSRNGRPERSLARRQSEETNSSPRPATLLSEEPPPEIQEPILPNRSTATKKRPIDSRDSYQNSPETPSFDNEKLLNILEERSRSGMTIFPLCQLANMPSFPSERTMLMRVFEASVTPDESRTLSVPYFRYFGPTAIVPGFKQMVVRVKEHRPGNDPHFPVSSQSSQSIASPQN